jgi:TetR/AcrR family transcriptional regulator, transcriptional repressor for nem operon
MDLEETFWQHKASCRIGLPPSSDGFRTLFDPIAEAASAWRPIVKTYLSPEHCDHAECGCPLASLAPESARADKAMKADILGELMKYKDRRATLKPCRKWVRRCNDRDSAVTILLKTFK